MALLTATEVTQLSNISATAGTITTLALIPEMQDRLCITINNYFTTDLDLQGPMTFNATAATIVNVGSESWLTYGFRAGQDIFVYNSYENDGFYTIDSIAGSSISLISGSTVVDELSGRSILVSVIKWPTPLKRIAALMIEFDYDTRGAQSPNLKSKSLGPWSESYTIGAENPFGYPDTIIEMLGPYRVARTF